MSASDVRPLPTLRQLYRAIVIAALSALVILVAAVLPAEYGIDPTGIGKKLGLVRLAASGEKPLPATSAAPLDPASFVSAVVQPRSTPFRTEEMMLVLKPGEGSEIKASMAKGDPFVFDWTVVGGKVEFDMHGEAINARNDEFTSYWKGTEQASAYGAFTAPFAGTHGWYWLNKGDRAVTVRVKVSGFYEKLYRP